MDILIKLLFSNAWILIVVFLLVRMFTTLSKQSSRKGTGGMGSPVIESRPNPKPVPMRPSREILIDQDFAPNPIFKKGNSQQVDIEMIKTKESKARNHNKEPDQVDKKKPSTPWASAVEGMMWSEVFGPPRSKKPYQRK